MAWETTTLPTEDINNVAKDACGSASCSQTLGKTVPTVDGGSVLAILDAPIEVDSSNIASTVLADHYVTQSQICVGISTGTDGIC